MTILHKDLSGSDLHEPKGIDSAASNTGYFADGGGSGSWRKIVALDLDTSSIFTTNKVRIPVVFKTASSAGSLVIPIFGTLTLDNVYAILSANITTSNMVLTFNKNGTSSAGTITFNYSGSAKGNQQSLAPSANNTFIAGDWIDIVSGGSGGTADVTLILEFSVTG